MVKVMTKLPKNLIRYDHENETIYVSRAIYKNSLVYQSSEFNLVKRAHEAFPNYKVLPRERIKSLPPLQSDLPCLWD